MPTLQAVSFENAAKNSQSPVNPPHAKGTKCHANFRAITQSGVSGVAIFPTDPASTATLVATLSSKAAQPDARRGFIAFLLTRESAAVRHAKGLMPGRSAQKDQTWIFHH